jgi:hypothetical protein
MKKTNKNLKIEEEVKKTLDCFDLDKRIEPSPTFFIKLRTKIRNLEAKSRDQKILFLRPGLLGVSLLVMLVALNLVFGILVFQTEKQQPENREDSISSIVSYYNLNQRSLDLSLLSEDKR